MQERVLEKHSDNRIYSFTIHGEHYGKNCFPGLNDILHEQGRHPMSYANLKRKYENIAINSIRYYLKGWKAKNKVILTFEFGEKSKGKKRDYDNIECGAKKIIIDALVKAGTLKDDSPDYVLPCEKSVFCYADKPYITVYVREV